MGFLGLAAAAPGLRGGEEDVGEVHAETVPTRNLADSIADVGEGQDDVLADTFPDVSTGLDIPGPYTEEPSEAEAKSPKTAIHDWDNATSLQAAAFNTWGQSFCETHHTGYFCDGTTRVRCCRKTWGFVKCGTTYQSNSWVAGRRRPEPWRRLEHPSRMASELILPIAPCRLLLLLAPQSALLQRFWALRGLHDDSRTRLALLKLSCACIAEVLSNTASREGRVQAGLGYIASSSFCALTHPRGALV